MTDVTDATLDDRELRDDKGQHCSTCEQHFKYQYLYDDHLPCRSTLPLDPTTAAIAAQNAERDQLRVDVARLERALVAAYTEVEVVKADRDRRSQLGDTMFIEGFDQAVREVRTHFAKQKRPDVVAEIDKTWSKETS